MYRNTFGFVVVCMVLSGLACHFLEKTKKKRKRKRKRKHVSFDTISFWLCAKIVRSLASSAKFHRRSLSPLDPINGWLFIAFQENPDSERRHCEFYVYSYFLLFLALDLLDFATFLYVHRWNEISNITWSVQSEEKVKRLVLFNEIRSKVK